MTIQLGDGTGDFSAAATSPETAGNDPLAVAVGDFNGDGKPDLAIANPGSRQRDDPARRRDRRLHRRRHQPRTRRRRSPSVAVGDFNGDGKPDLATANFSSDNVTILLGDGSGNFTAAATSPEAAGDGPQSVAVGDFNGDGKPDLAIANGGSDNVTILLGDGTGNFTAAATSPETAGDGARSVAVGDFNSDGKPDLAIANINCDQRDVLLGTGTGRLHRRRHQPRAAGTSPASVAVGDFNGDGKPDLAVANFSSRQRRRSCSATAAATSPPP